VGQDQQKVSWRCHIFVDDGRATGQTVEHAWAISRQGGSRFQYKGIQDASRKRKPPARKPGAWAGAVFATPASSVTKTVTKEKWEKAKRIVNALQETISAEKNLDKVLLDYKELEIARGFLGHLSMTFEIMVPYLKGFHLTLSAHLKQKGCRWLEND
jgi:hypothetical protein